jgi:hypothetical protein
MGDELLDPRLQCLGIIGWWRVNAPPVGLSGRETSRSPA